jgi:hypothetical protein
VSPLGSTTAFEVVTAAIVAVPLVLVAFTVMLKVCSETGAVKVTTAKNTVSASVVPSTRVAVTCVVDVSATVAWMRADHEFVVLAGVRPSRIGALLLVSTAVIVPTALVTPAPRTIEPYWTFVTVEARRARIVASLSAMLFAVGAPESAAPSILSSCAARAAV